jgi:hypothetical protein
MAEESKSPAILTKMKCTIEDTEETKDVPNNAHTEEQNSKHQPAKGKQ